MTERLYYEQSYLKEFDARVVEASPDGARLYLDCSAFYPTSGGQPFDRGVIELVGGGAARVVDVVDEGERVAHVLEPLAEASPAMAPGELAPGTPVRGRIDWPRRFDHMQQHTGQHLLSALFQERLGLATLSVHFGADASTLDLDAPALAPVDVVAIETLANAAVAENRRVSAAVDSGGASSGLRKPSTRTGDLRIVSIDGLDKSACGGTHVSRTAEIGPILLRRLERVRKATRIEFVCGGRALRRARADYEILARLAQTLGTSIDDVTERTTTRLAELKRQAAELETLRERLDAHRARELYTQTPPGERGLRVHVERHPSGALQDLRGLAQAFVAQPRAVFVAAIAAPPALLIGTSPDSGLEARRLLARALADAGGQGGGSPRLAQGRVPTVEALERALGVVEQQAKIQL